MEQPATPGDVTWRYASYPLTPWVQEVGDFTGPDLRAAIEGHVLDSALVWGSYTLNPRLID